MSELNEKQAAAWEGFTKGDWQNEVNVRDFIQKTTPRTKVTNPSWLALLKRRPTCGIKSWTVSKLKTVPMRRLISIPT